MKKRGRPRSFDEDTVIWQLTQVFWQNGFAATSLDDLCAATNLTRPSLYSAFGGKLDMFVLCLEHFSMRLATTTQEATQGAIDFDEALNGFFSNLLDVYFTDESESHGLGCLIFSNAVVSAIAEPEIQEVVVRTLDMVGSQLQKLIKGHHPDATEDKVDEAFELLLSTFLGLGVRVRSGANRLSVERTVSTSIKAIDSILAP